MSALPATSNRGTDRAIRVYVTPAERGWDVHGEVDGRIMMTQHYDDWHRVERSCARLEAALLRLHATADATSVAA
jgi:hypothetical protein